MNGGVLHFGMRWNGKRITFERLVLIFTACSIIYYFVNPLLNLIQVRILRNENVKYINTLTSILDAKVFGQPSANAVIIHAIKTWLGTVHPSKPLVLSFHGTTGTGKTYTANVLGAFLRDIGKVSAIQWRDSTVHYQLTAHQYRAQLRDFITRCGKVNERTLFVFDEFDKMPSGLSEILVPYLSHSKCIERVDYRKSVFIFLNNYGGEQVHDSEIHGEKRKSERVHVHEKASKEGRRSLSCDVSLNSHHALSPVSRYIDFYVPFVPLERAHVEKCVRVELDKDHQGLNQSERTKLIENVADEMQYEDRFSITGCKMVRKKLDLYT